MGEVDTEIPIDFLDTTRKQQQFQNDYNDAKLTKLSILKQNALDLFSTLDTFHARKEHLLLSIAAMKWYFGFAGKVLEKFDALEARKLRTHVGLTSEKLVKLLMKLDEVQSEGNVIVKKERKMIVKMINNEFLPKADKLLLEAQKIVTLYNKVIRLTKTMERNKEPEKELEQAEISFAAEGTNEKDIEADDTLEIERKPANDRTGSNVNISLSAEESDEPKYEVEETGESVVILISLPRSEKAAKLEFQVDERTNELLVTGRTFQLPFAINKEKYVIGNAKVKMIDERKVLVEIPKRLRRSTAHFPRYTPVYSFDNRRTSPYNQNKSQYARQSSPNYARWPNQYSPSPFEMSSPFAYF